MLLDILIYRCLVLRFFKDFAAGNPKHKIGSSWEFYLLEETQFSFFFFFLVISESVLLSANIYKLFSNQGMFHFWNYRKTFLMLAKETRAG